jgi:hypothetical protein
MHGDVAECHNVCPFDGGVSASEFGRKAGSGFADYDQLLQDGALA